MTLFGQFDLKSNKNEKPDFAGGAPWLARASALFCICTATYSVARMISTVLSGATLQYADYWLMIESTLKPDGSLNPLAFFNFSNHHFVAFPQLLYWINLKLFSGSNVSLGLIDIAIVCCLLGVLIAMVRSLPAQRTLKFAIVGLAGTLLFSLLGSWNFTRGMSGAAWLSANLFVVMAIYQRSVGRYKTAYIAAVLATVSYGTGLFGWLAVIAVGFVRRPVRQWWKEWPYGLSLIVSIFVVRSLSNNVGDTSTNDYVQVAKLAAEFLGASAGLGPGWDKAVGSLILLGIPACVAWLVFFRREKTLACWVGLGIYAWTAILVIVQGRAMFMALFGYPGRYYSLAALAWLSFIVMLIFVFRSLVHIRFGGRKNELDGPQHSHLGKPAFLLTIIPYVLVSVLSVSALISGAAEVAKRDKGLFGQQLKEIALQLDVVDGSVGYLEGFSSSEKRFDSTSRLRKTGHYPFVEEWDLDCGLLGKKLEYRFFARKSGEVRNVGSEKGLSSVVRIGGILPIESDVKGMIRCIVVSDQDGLVVGVGIARPKVSAVARQHFSALAHDVEGGHNVLVFDEGSEPILLGVD